jgi:hypothetical protein
MEDYLPLFPDEPDDAFPPCDPAVPEAARSRLSRQCLAILGRLRQGRATNQELALIAIKYTSRVSDARKAGYDIRCVGLDHQTGVAWYALFVNGVEVKAE